MQGFFPPNIPVESLRATGIAVDFISRLKLRNPVVVAPNESCIQLAHDMRSGLQRRLGQYVGLAAIIQAGASRGSDRYAHVTGPVPVPVPAVQSGAGAAAGAGTKAAAAASATVGSGAFGNGLGGVSVPEDMELVGDVFGRDVVICDDMIDTARTLVTRLHLLKDRGAQRIVAYASHGLFTGAALQRIARSPLSEVVVTNTVPLGTGVEAQHTHKIVQISVAPLLAEAIVRMQTGQSLQDLRIFDRDSAEPRYKGQE